MKTLEISVVIFENVSNDITQLLVANIWIYIMLLNTLLDCWGNAYNWIHFWAVNHHSTCSCKLDSGLEDMLVKFHSLFIIKIYQWRCYALFKLSFKLRTVVELDKIAHFFCNLVMAFANWWVIWIFWKKWGNVNDNIDFILFQLLLELVPIVFNLLIYILISPKFCISKRIVP